MIRKIAMEAPAWNKREIMRYARIRGADDVYEKMINNCIKEAESVLSYRVCYMVLPVIDEAQALCLGNIKAPYQTIKKAIKNAQEVLLFAATVGAPFDRLIQKYSLLEPSKALMMQAIGAERAESLCDAFCDMMNTELRRDGKSLTPRVSPGYGDIPMEMQRDIFTVLDCSRQIGLTLDESLLMSPSKSVTAIAGIVEDCLPKNEKCNSCDKTDCAYRGYLK
ncbi:MAG: Vitamin B12 dependent methionine synthase activation subunit [Ruminococcus sp.]|nr:Vitamin B12 dependent methionine synthase activation subunit [Ruminococcus sp.]